MPGSWSHSVTVLSLTRALGAEGSERVSRSSLFPLGPDRLSAASPAYRAATLLLHLAALVASSDGDFGESEERHLEEHIEQSMKLNEDEIRRLRAHLQWLIAEKPSTAGIKRRLESVDASRRQILAEFAIAMAGADGLINSKEIGMLEKIYGLLGLDPKQAYGDIHSLQTGDTWRPAEHPITVRPPGLAEAGRAIPNPPPPVPERDRIELDMDRVERTLAQTEEISRVLAEVFADEPGEIDAPEAESRIEHRRRPRRPTHSPLAGSRRALRTERRGVRGTRRALGLARRWSLRDSQRGGVRLRRQPSARGRQPSGSRPCRDEGTAGMTSDFKIRPRVRDAIIQSLRSGVTPRIGQTHVQVGRSDEVQALIRDIDRIADGGACFRLVIGDYGSGKTFFLNLVRSVALEKKLVTAQADLNPDRRLHASGGQARSLFRELMRSVATRSKPDGGALASVVERFVSSARTRARDEGVTAEAIIRERLVSLTEMVGGYDFSEVVAAYWRGHETGDDDAKASAVRWLRGEFATKTDARKALGVRTIVDDSNVYDHLKLMARFVCLAGYQGFLVCLDEMVNLYKLPSGRARSANYEQILRILNDSLQGAAVGLGFVLGGTPEFLLDTRKGLYSYEALQSRLATNSFAREGLVDMTGPVVRLANLSPEDLYVLLGKIRQVYAAGDSAGAPVPDEALHAFMQHCSQRIGEAYFRTPRNTIKEFVNLLAVLDQNPAASWQQLVGTVEIPPEGNPDLAPIEASDEDDDGLASFQL